MTDTNFGVPSQASSKNLLLLVVQTRTKKSPNSCVIPHQQNNEQNSFSKAYRYRYRIGNHLYIIHSPTLCIYRPKYPSRTKKNLWFSIRPIRFNCWCAFFPRQLNFYVGDLLSTPDNSYSKTFGRICDVQRRVDDFVHPFRCCVSAAVFDSVYPAERWGIVMVIFIIDSSCADAKPVIDFCPTHNSFK